MMVITFVNKFVEGKATAWQVLQGALKVKYSSNYFFPRHG